MTRDKRPDEIDRERAPEPVEPLGTRAKAIGTVKWWRDAKGHGVIASGATAPWDIWCHFAHVARIGGIVTLPSGERLQVRYDDEGRAFLPSGEPITAGVIEHSEPVTLSAGEPVEVDYIRADQESFRYVAIRVRRLSVS